MEPPIEWTYTSFDIWLIFVSLLSLICQVAKCVEFYCAHCESMQRINRLTNYIERLSDE